MSHKWLQDCHRKTAYETKAEADAEAARHPGQVSYRCCWCERHHLGHGAGNRRRSGRRKAAGKQGRA